MAIVHSAAIVNATALSVLAAIDAATAGTLQFRTAADAPVASLVLQLPSGAVVGAVLTFFAPNSDVDCAGGDITKFVMMDSASNVVIEGSVSLSAGGGDMILTNLNINPGDKLNVTGAVYTAV